VIPVVPSRGRVYFFLILTTLFWGGSFLFSKIGLREFPPLAFVCIRFSLAALILMLVFYRRLPLLNSALIRRGAIVGFALGVTNICFVFGVKDTSISRAGILNNLFVLFIPLITRLIWKDRVGGTNLVGIGLATVGIWLLATGGGIGFNRGDMISTLCALFIACHIITISKVLRNDDVFMVSMVQFATVALMSGTALLLTGSALPVTFSVQAMFSVVYCAIFPTVVCFTLQNNFQRYVTPTRAGLIYTLDPVWGLIAGYFVLSERLTPTEWIGCTIIFLAAFFPLAVRYFMERNGLCKS
jgi:drug/metabolite transporter (DMT)-like permease